MLGTNFGDLPKGGVNLRLYVFDPPNSPNCQMPGWVNGCYNTGHYDASLPGGPCSASDPQGFDSWDKMSAYAGARGETLVLVSRPDLAALCSYRPPAVQPITYQPPVATPYQGGTTYSGAPAGVTIQPIGGQPGGPPAWVPGYIPQPGTPVQSGGVPSGSSVGQTRPRLMSLYRFILYKPDPTNPYATGANYPGCSQTNTSGCRPMGFPTLQDAIDYAEANNEIPYRVDSEAEAWALNAGDIDIDPRKILGKQAVSHFGTSTLLLVALGLWFLSGR